ncbi:hypothetical protein ACQP1W_09695 [Spirillospora sp. CA-255316]
MLVAVTLLSGCSEGVSTGALPPASAVPKVPVPSTSVTLRSFEKGEIRSTPDPRTLLSPSLRQDLRFADDKGSRCKKEESYDRMDEWECYLFTPRQASKSDMTSIRVMLQKPTDKHGATAKATQEFADLKWYRRTFTPCTVLISLGDDGCQTPRYTSSLKWSAVMFRVRNVIVNVQAASGDKDRASVLALSDEQARRAWRVASELARGLEWRR